MNENQDLAENACPDYREGWGMKALTLKNLILFPKTLVEHVIQ
jgi:hypothetical protein